MAVKPHGLANRPGEPYPATFRMQWTHRESNSDFRHARAVSSRWTMSPSSAVDRPGNRTPISSVQTRHLPVGRAAQLSEVRLGIEPSLPPYHGGVQPQHLQTTSDPGWNRTITFLHVTQVSSPLDHGIKLLVTEVGVEPTQSQVLGLLALPVCVPGQSVAGPGVAPGGRSL
jgi:hypothetical protein